VSGKGVGIIVGVKIGVAVGTVVDVAGATGCCVQEVVVKIASTSKK